MNRIRKEVSGKTRSGLVVRFEDQSLTSHAGLVVFQGLFSRLGLKERLRGCFRHESGRRTYAPHAVTLLLVVHLLVGCRELRDMVRYRNDEAVRRAVGLRRLPDVSTVSRALSDMDARGADRLRALARDMALDRLRALAPAAGDGELRRHGAGHPPAGGRHGGRLQPGQEGAAELLAASTTMEGRK